MRQSLVTNSLQRTMKNTEGGAQRRGLAAPESETEDYD